MRAIVLDLDGTLCLGDAPVLRVAWHAFGSLDADARDRAEAVLAAFLAGERALLPQARDGYDAVARLAEREGLPHRALHDAFMTTRAEHELWLPEVHAPAALIEALGALDGVRRVLVTNSPEIGIERVLGVLGIDAVVDEVVTSAGKPHRMPEVLDRLGVRAEARSLAGMGDRWANDLEEIHGRGGTTFHVDHGGWTEGAPTHRGGHPDELVPALLRWHAA